MERPCQGLGINSSPYFWGSCFSMRGGCGGLCSLGSLCETGGSGGLRGVARGVAVDPSSAALLWGCQS
eukprot:15472528-Alexandrium_andersonii.AAC.1